MTTAIEEHYEHNVLAYTLLMKGNTRHLQKAKFSLQHDS